MKHLKFQPPCACEYCLRQYRSPDLLGPLFNYRGHLELEEVETLVKSHKQSIEKDRRFIHAALSVHGDLMVKKWRRDRKQREKWLKKVYPNIPSLDTPAINIAMNGGLPPGADLATYRTTFLLPYLTLQSLVEDASRMIGMLFHRATAELGDWVLFDESELQDSWNHGILTEKSAHGCIKLHGADLGTLKAFDADSVHRRIFHGAPRALLILDAQRILFEFMRQLVTTILDDKDKIGKIASTPDTSTLTIGDKFSRYLSNRTTRLSSRPAFGRIYGEQPFTTAPRYDIRELISISRDKAAEKQDELWLLQTDLEYVQDRVKFHEKTWFDRGQHSDIPEVTKECKANNLATLITTRPVTEARGWREIYEQCQNIEKEAMFAAPSTDTVGYLSPRYEKALGHLLFLLREELEDMQVNLRRCMRKSPVFQPYFEFKTWQTEDSPIAQGYAIVPREPETLYHRDRLAWCLFMLTVEPMTYSDMAPNAVHAGHDHHFVLQHLDSYISTQPYKESQRIDSVMCRILTDLTAVERMMYLLNLHRPSFRTLSLQEIPERYKVWLVRYNLGSQPRLMSAEEMNLGPAYKRLLESFPPKGIQDEQWLRRRDEAHKKLRLLWEEARDRYYVMYTRVKVLVVLLKPELESMQQCDSKELQEQLEREKIEILTYLEAAKERSLSHHFDAALRLQDSDSSGAQLDVEPRTKIKTRPERTVEGDIPKEIPGLEKLDVEQRVPLYVLSETSPAWKVLSLLFPSAMESDLRASSKAPIDWSDFVSMMQEVGLFGSYRGGSVVTFRGDIFVSGEEGVQKRNINIHKPHPSTEMGPILVRTIGRRFNRRFGWSMDCFQRASTKAT